MVQDGFTHYPQQRDEFRFFRGDWRTPSRIVLIDGSGGLTFDVLDWLHSQAIELLRINWRGEVISVAGGHGYACDRAIVAMQVAGRDNGRALQLARYLIGEKLANSAAALRDALPGSLPIDCAIEQLRRDAELLTTAQSVGDILGIEGRAAATYFGAWRSVPLKWKATNRHPIPDDWRRIGWRSSPANNKPTVKRNAAHPMNAMLNYAYGILENQVRAQTLAAGLDPTIGTLHGVYGDKHALVFDLMEPLRPAIDRQLLKFIQTQTFGSGDFTITSEGICRLNPQLARHVVSLSLKQEALQAPIGDALKILDNAKRQPKVIEAVRVGT